MNGFLSTAPIPAEMINHSHSSERLTPFFRTPISNSFYSHKAISPISSENNRSRLLKPSKFNYSYSFHHFFILQRTSNPSAIPRFHVSSLQLSSFLLFYRFHIGSWNDYNMEYSRTLPNSSAYVTDCCQSSSFSRGTVCVV